MCALIGVKEAQLLSPIFAMRIAASAEDFKACTNRDLLDAFAFAGPPHDFFREATIGVHGEGTMRDIARLHGLRFSAGERKTCIFRRSYESADRHIASPCL